MNSKQRRLARRTRPAWGNGADVAQLVRDELLTAEQGAVLLQMRCKLAMVRASAKFITLSVAAAWIAVVTTIVVVVWVR